MNTRRTMLLGALAATAGAVARPVAAQSWPSRPLRIVVPLPPGSAGDAIPRSIAQRMQAGLGQPVIIDNRPGASGVIGAEAVAKAAPDGHTLLSAVSTIAIQPHFGRTPYDLARDLVPVSQTVSGSYVLVVSPSFPADDLQGFVQAVRRAPAKFNYASHGNGSGPHLAMELLKSQARLFIVHVPFRGAAPAMLELLAGRVEMAFDTTVAAMPHIRAGRLKPIAVGGPQPVAVLPGIAPVAQMFPGFDTDGWQGMFVPAGTPPDVVARLNGEIVKAVRAPEFVKSMADLGFAAVGSTPEQFAAVVQRDHARWGELIRARGIQAD